MMKLTKLLKTPAKLETEIFKVVVSIQDAVEASDSRVRVERLISTAQEVLTKVVAKNDKCFALGDKTSSPATLEYHVADYWEAITNKNGESLSQVRNYMTRSSPMKISPKSLQQWSKTISGTTKTASRTSSQIKKDIFLVKLRHEEVEKQNENN